MKKREAIECPKCLTSENVIKGGKTRSAIPKQKYKCISCPNYFVLNPLRVHGVVKPSKHSPIPSIVTIDGCREKTMADLGRKAGISREAVRMKIQNHIPILGKIWSKDQSMRNPTKPKTEKRVISASGLSPDLAGWIDRQPNKSTWLRLILQDAYDRENSKCSNPNP